MDILNKAIEHHKKGEIIDAEKLYQKVLKENPNYSDAIYYLGHIELSKKNKNKALSYFKKAIDINPNKEIYIKDFLNLFISTGNLDEAIMMIEKALTNFPNSYEINFILALVYYRKSNLEKAILYYKKTVGIKPNYYQAYNNLGVALLDINKLKEAEENFKKAISLEPNFISAHNNLGLALKALHKKDESEFHFQKAIQLNPEFKDLDIKIKNGEWIQSKEKLEKFIVKNSIDTKRILDVYIFSWCNFCINQIKEQNFKKFGEIFVNLLKIERKNHNIEKLANYYFSKHNLSRILSFVRKEDQLLMHVSYCQFKLLKGQYDEAEKIATSNIRKSRELIINKENENLGWLIIKRSMLMFQSKILARENLNLLISKLNLPK